MLDDVNAEIEFNREQLQTVLPKRLLHQFQIILSSKDCLENWYWALLTTMLDSVMRVCEDPGRTMDEKDALPAASWNARNLLELWIWTEYCAASVENAWRFHGDALRDVAGIVEANDRLIASLTGVDASAEVPAKEMLDAIAAKALGEASIDSNYQKVLQTAKLVGLGDIYTTWNKQLSKFAHPTALLVLKVMPNNKFMRIFQALSTGMSVHSCRRCANVFDKIIAAIPAEKLKQS